MRIGLFCNGADYFDVWAMVDYEDASGVFDIRKDRIQEAVKSTLKLMDEFREDE